MDTGHADASGPLGHSANRACSGWNATGVPTGAARSRALRTGTPAGEGERARASRAREARAAIVAATACGDTLETRAYDDTTAATLIRTDH